MPPSILQMQGFWAQLLSRTEEWAMETFDLESQPILSSRRVVTGRVAADMAENPFTLFFASDVSPGLCAIAFDAASAVRCAAIRLRQDPSSLEEASPLFLKLLSEQPTVALWQKLANGLTGHDVLAREDPKSNWRSRSTDRRRWSNACLKSTICRPMRETMYVRRLIERLRRARRAPNP